jgi:hypothetical protein
LLALAQDPIKALYVVGLYIVVQIIESNLITPFIERRTIELPPALTIVMQLILSVFVGGLGLILATPLVAAGIVSCKNALCRRRFRRKRHDTRRTKSRSFVDQKKQQQMLNRESQRVGYQVIWLRLRSKDMKFAMINL